MTDLQDLFEFMEAHNIDDLPDGAWWAATEFAVKSFNDTRGTDFNPSDMVVAWIKQR